MATQGIWNIQQPDGYTRLRSRDYEPEKNLWRPAYPTRNGRPYLCFSIICK